MQIADFEGAGSKVQNFIIRIVTAAILASAIVFMAACSGGDASTSSNDTAATINGKAIKMEEVERAVKMQAKGQETKLSQLELAGARLQVLQSLIEQEVMFQKAEKENTVPTDDEVNAEVNKQKVDSRLSAEEFERQMQAAGMDDKSFRESIRKGLAIKKLVDKITGKIETPKDQEITDFYKGNPEMFIKKRGVRLAAIVIDPANTGQGDTTTNEQEASLRAKEVLTKLQQPGSDFAALAREYSEDPSKLQGGDLGYFSEEELKQNYPQLATGFMNPEFTVGRVTSMVPINGKGYIFKLQERNEKEETLTLESPNVKPQITEMLVNNRKQLLAASYQAIAMNEAKIENHLAKKVVENPNELSGARPAGASTPAANANTPAPAANTAPAAPNENAASNTAGRPAGNAAANANTRARPAGNGNTAPNANRSS